MKKKILSFLQIIISIFFIYYTFSKIDLTTLIKIFSNLNIIPLIFVPIVYFLSQIISAERLKYIFSQNNLQISFSSNLKLYLIGMFYNFFLPGAVGGDAYKGYLINRDFKWGLKKTFKLLLLDRAIGFGVLICLLVLLDQNLFIKINLLIKFLIFISFFIIGYFLVKKIFKNEKTYFISFGYSIIIQLFQFLSIFIILYSLGIDGNLIAVLYVFILSSMFSVFSFGGIGIREYIFLISASSININPEIATSIGLIFTICCAVSSIPGLYYLIRKPKLI